VKFCYFFGANVQRLHCKAQVSQLRNRCQIIRRTLNCDWLLTFVVCFIIQCDNCSHCCWSSAHWPKPVSTATGKFYWQFLLVILFFVREYYDSCWSLMFTSCAYVAR